MVVFNKRVEVGPLSCISIFFSDYSIACQLSFLIIDYYLLDRTVLLFTVESSLSNERTDLYLGLVTNLSLASYVQ
jgi:hypothetical protein